MRTASALISTFLAVTLAGCSAVPEFNATTPVSAANQGAAIRGTVRGGQSPIVGAHVYLYAVNTTGYGGAGIAASSSNASISLLTSGTGNPADGNGNYYVTTDADGNFSITGDYTCPAIASPVYFYSAGGNPGAGTNSAAVLLAGFNGDCPASGTLPSTDVFQVNEISTIATAYALAGFATDATHISSSGTTKAQAGILHAADAAETLANILANGQARTELPAGNGTVPQSEIDTLANILAACVNSNGAISATPTPTPCYTLFNNALSGGTTGTTPADTATAAINIAHNPWANISNLFALQGSSPPFAPDLSAAPNDFTIAINQTSGGLSTPFGIALDGSGDVWVANNGSTGAGTTISEFNGNGGPQPDSPISGGGLNGPYLIAIDSNTNVWVTDNNTGTLSYFESNGSPIFTNGFGDVSEPIGIAIDTSNDAWVANSCNSGCSPENSISVFTDSGGENTPVAGFTGGGMNDPVVVAIDTSGNVWVTNGGAGANSITELGSTGVKSGSPITGGGLDQPGDIVVDASGNLWVGDEDSNSLTVYDPATKTFPSGASGYSGGGLNVPYGVAIDGAGNVWVANYGSSGTGNSISEFTSSGTAVTSSTGYQGGLSAPYDIAVDSAGNVWVTSAGNSSITKFVGAASPVVTPIVSNLLSPYGSHAVNKP
jgi:streptogramin lyase